MYVKIGYRVYRENSRQYFMDEYGKYEGYGSNNDQWIPLFSPRIKPFGSKTGKRKRDIDLMEEYDSFV